MLEPEKLMALSSDTTEIKSRPALLAATEEEAMTRVNRWLHREVGMALNGRKRRRFKDDSNAQQTGWKGNGCRGSQCRLEYELDRKLHLPAAEAPRWNEIRGADVGLASLDEQVCMIEGVEDLHPKLQMPLLVYSDLPRKACVQRPLPRTSERIARGHIGRVWAQVGSPRDRTRITAGSVSLCAQIDIPEEIGLLRRGGRLMRPSKSYRACEHQSRARTQTVAAIEYREWLT